jgi:hypothetical protein
MGEAGAVVGALGVDHGERRRQLVGRQVVVGDDDADPGGARARDRLHGGDAAVAGDDQRGAGRPRGGEPGGPEVVSIAQPVRHEGNHVGTRGAERAGEHRRGALAVHVVVTVDHDGAAGAHGRGDRVHRLRHAGERAGIREITDGGPQIPARHVGVSLPPLHQQGGERVGQVQPSRQSVDRRLLGPGRHHPAEDRRLGTADYGKLHAGAGHPAGRSPSGG